MENKNITLTKAQKYEAFLRMKKLNLHENVLREFLEDDKINLSENGGILYWANEEEVKMIENFEKEYSGKVYHIIKNKMEFGLCYSLLYVSAETEEWELDNEDLEDGIATAYVYNKDVPEFSEFGSIGIKPCIGGLVRTA